MLKRLLHFRPAIRALRGIHDELRRMNDLREWELAHSGLHFRPPVADTSGPEPETSYVDEEADAIREIMERSGRRGRGGSGDAEGDG